MENQAEYKTKNRQFHGDYTSPGQARLDDSIGQGSRKNQDDFGLELTLYMYGGIIGMFIFAVLYIFGAWLWNEFLKHWISLLFILAITAGCSPGQMVGTGYLVTVEEGIQMKWDRVETASEADRFIFEKTGLQVKTDSLIGTTYPYWDMKNGRKYIYVGKQGIYQRRPGGKKRWRVYDEQLQAPSNSPKGEEKEISNNQ